MKNIIIAGASGHAKMIMDIIHKNNNFNIVGLVDSFKEVGDEIYGHKIIGKTEDIENLRKQYDVFGIIIAVGDNTNRKDLKEKIDSISPEINFINAIHPSAILANDIVVPMGTIIMAGVIVNADTKIGEFCILNSKSSLGHDSVMEDFSSLASGATTGGNVHIGTCSAICLDASIIQNISIGKHTVIGASSLVVKSIGDYKRAFGVPINNIKERACDTKYLS